MSDSQIEDLLAKQAIYEVLCRYCRGLDRMDKAMAYSVWHPGATAIYHGIYEGTGAGFVEWVWGAHLSLERHSHQITNALIDVDGDSAKSETYVTVVLWTAPDDSGGQTEITGKGRYLDQWSKIEGTWAIAHREYVRDMETIHDVKRGTVDDISRRDINDPSFRFIQKA